MLFASPYPSPFGPLALLLDEAAQLHRIAFLASPEEDLRQVFKRYGKVRLDAAPSHEVRHQLDAYYRGQRWHFELPLAPKGTPFQQEVWRYLLEIPVGETRSYRQLAEHIGRPRAVRAVGRANATNPIPIVIPCHRLVGSDGSLTGFAGGLEMKRALLEHESRRRV
jgi:methylated-DNA-[protein]-cysteine S-methyltransferase